MWTYFQRCGKPGLSSILCFKCPVLSEMNNVDIFMREKSITLPIRSKASFLWIPSSGSLSYAEGLCSIICCPPHLTVKLEGNNPVKLNFMALSSCHNSLPVIATPTVICQLCLIYMDGERKKLTKWIFDHLAQNCSAGVHFKIHNQRLIHWLRVTHSFSFSWKQGHSKCHQCGWGFKSTIEHREEECQTLE